MRHDAMHYTLFFCLIIVCGFLLFQTNSDIEHKSIEQINNEQIVHAKQAEDNIHSFFHYFNNSLFFLADNPNIIDLNPQGTELLRKYFLTHDDEILSITRTDEDGIIIYSFPNESSVGANISSQSHVQQIMRTHKKTISDVFTSVQGLRSVAFHVPVFSGDTYKGSLALLIPFDALAKKSLKEIRILSSGYAYAVSKEGVMLYSPYPEQIDHSVYDLFNASPSVLALIGRSLSGGEGVGTYQYNPYSADPNDYQTFHVIYRTFDIEDQTWSILVATPEREILSTLQNFRRDLMIIFVIIMIAVLFFAYYHAKARGIIREEEKRKKVESALRLSERNYRSIFDAIQDVFYRTDLEGNLQMMSPSGVALFGYDSIDEVLEKNIAEVFYDNSGDRSELKDILHKSGSVHNYEVILKRRDGSIMYGQTSSHCYYDENGELMGVEGILHDVTDQKMAHAALAQALKKLNLLNSVTFNNIQNDIFSISAYFDILKSMVSESLLVDFIEKEEKLSRSIMNTLNFAKDYQGLGMKPSIWQPIIHSYLFGISHADLSKISRTVDIHEIEIFADPLLEKVFFILAENIVLHSKTATVLRFYEEEGDEGLHIYFEDNGIGIPTELKERIFERGSGSNKGMGLFLAREILGITDITIKETGIPGKGARFEIIVPKNAYRSVKRSEER